MKYVNTEVVFQELPDETTLAINISSCPCHCKGCHSSYLAEDIGEILTVSRLEKLAKDNEGITAICFMGGDNDPKLINHYANAVKNFKKRVVCDTFTLDKEVKLPGNKTVSKGSQISTTKIVPMELKVGWYSGKQELSKDIDIENFDYIKLGPYIEDLGGLKSPNTNQRLYKIIDGEMIDITNKFWKL